MKIIEPSVKVVHVSHPEPSVFIEDTARICYQSHDHTKPGSAEKMIKNLVKNGHHAMLEFVDIIADFTINRAISHEIVRQRLCSFAQESQRYVKYKTGIEFIRPAAYDTELRKWQIWERSITRAEMDYLEMVAYDATPQEAREVLPNSTATRIRVKANLRQWIHIFKLRTSNAADPNMQAVAKHLNEQCKIICPEVFGS